MERRQFAVAAYRRACRLDVETRKPGNVSVHAGGHAMQAKDFLISAAASAAPLTEMQLGLGQRIHAAVAATRNRVGCNTNLGILLIAAPLLESFMRLGPGEDLRERLGRVLLATSIEDAVWCFKAICLAAPGGLGAVARHDVNKPAVVNLLEAMHAASESDRIAWQYVSRYADIFDVALPLLEDSPYTVLQDLIPTVYLLLLARIPDTHIRRKFGDAKAVEISQRAASLQTQLQACATPQAKIALLDEMDRELKHAGINPGTSADLTVGALLAQQLVSHQIFPTARSDGVASQTLRSASFHQSQSTEISYGYR